MKSDLQLRFVLFAILLAVLIGTPAAILAAAQGNGLDYQVHLPIVVKPGDPRSAGTLGNGGTVEGPGGVGIGALTDTLTAPIQVSISVTDTPTTTLPADIQVLGDFYQLGANEDVLVSPERPLIVAFPIPAGADTAHLALANLKLTRDLLDSPESPPSWHLLDGMVDEDQDLFLTTVASLKETGAVYTLVEHPDFFSPSNQSKRDPQGDRTDRESQSALFSVHCLYFMAGECTPATEAAVEAYLADIYNHIQDVLGFNPPRLRYLNETLEYNPNSLSSLGYSAYIEPFNLGTVLGGCNPNETGYYEILDGRLVLCYDATTGITEDSLKTLIHEFFHATQHGYESVLSDHQDGTKEEWVIEGTAASVEESYFLDEMKRSDSWGLHYADVTLKSTKETDEYRAQDFWVYYGQLGGLDMTYLKTILELGADSQDVVDALDSSGEILGVYWPWVKNHLMEPEVDYDGQLGTPCELEEPLALLPEPISAGSYSPNFHDFLVDPLGTIVVQIEFDWDGYTQAHGWVIPVPNPNLDPIATQALRYKFYEEGETDCDLVDDGYRSFLPPSQDKTYYLLITNTDHDNSHDYRVMWEIGPPPP